MGQKENEIQEDFIWGTGPESLYQMIRTEYKTEPDKKEQRFDQIIQRILPTKKKHLSQPRRTPLDQTVRNRNIGKLLAEIDRNRKRKRVRRNTNRKVTHFKIYDGNQRHKTPRQINKKRNWNWRKQLK